VMSLSLAPPFLGCLHRRSGAAARGRDGRGDGGSGSAICSNVSRGRRLAPAPPMDREVRPDLIGLLFLTI
jgi:hypothetical protein